MNRERGSVSVVLAAGVLVVLVLTLGVADLGRTLIARSRARSAADAAALAVAQDLAFPSGVEPAVLAADYARANGGELVACSCEPGSYEALVEVRVSVGDLLLVPGAPAVSAKARAVVDLPEGTAPP